MNQSNYQEYLKRIWYDHKHPASYAGPDKLHRLVKTEGKFKIGHTKIKQWLQDQNSHGLSRNLVRKFPRNRYAVNTIDSLWEMADVSNIRSHSQNYKYLLFVIDVFSRYLWIQPITEKTTKSVINALKIVLRSRKLNSIKSDKGSEFKNKEVRSFLKKEDIHTFYSQDETEDTLVERSIRTIKKALYRYFRHKQTYKYLDVLQDFARNYNKRTHRSLGQNSPAEVNQDNASEVRNIAYLVVKPRITKTIKKERKITKKETKSSRFKFKTGDLVRITYLRHHF